MSGEQITNNSIETQNMEGDLHSLKNNSKKKESRYKCLIKQSKTS